MKFHLFVLQVNGDVTDRQECDSRRQLSNPAARQFIDWFSSLLEERLAGNSEKKGRFQTPIGEADGYRLTWQQFNPLSAMCVMEVAGKPVGVCVFLYGFEPLHDAAAVEALQKIIVKWLADTPIEPGFGLRQITQRPAIISIPFHTDVAKNDQRAVSNILYCLGIAFFRQAAAFIGQVDRFWQGQGVTRHGPNPRRVQKECQRDVVYKKVATSKSAVNSCRCSGNFVTGTASSGEQGGSFPRRDCQIDDRARTGFAMPERLKVGRPYAARR